MMRRSRAKRPMSWLEPHARTLRPIHAASMGKFGGSNQADSYFKGMGFPTLKGSPKIFSAQDSCGRSRYWRIHQLNHLRVWISGKFPMDLWIPPLKIKNLAASKAWNLRFSVCGLAVVAWILTAWDGCIGPEALAFFSGTRPVSQRVSTHSKRRRSLTRANERASQNMGSHKHLFFFWSKACEIPIHFELSMAQTWVSQKGNIIYCSRFGISHCCSFAEGWRACVQPPVIRSAGHQLLLLLLILLSLLLLLLLLLWLLLLSLVLWWCWLSVVIILTIMLIILIIDIITIKLMYYFLFL